MIKRTLYFGNDAYLHLKQKQLVISYPDEDKPAKTVPVEDIGVVILDAFRLTLSLTLVSKLIENNVALITCDDKHMPQGMMLNLNGHTLQQERFRNQLNISVPLKKNLWQQTVQSKIMNQAALLAKQGYDVENMHYWASQVSSGDPKNYEGRAAAYYWKNLFNDHTDGFVRGRFESEPNNLLNYGYAILRATVARSLVGSGLLPTLGIHHHNKYNAYALADDIMEPYRPFVDQLVLELLDLFDQIDQLRPEIKLELLKIPAIDVLIDGKRSPLMGAVQQTTSSLAACYEGGIRKIKYPDFD